MPIESDIDVSLGQINDILRRLTPYRGSNCFISEAVPVLRDARTILESAQGDGQ